MPHTDRPRPARQSARYDAPPRERSTRLVIAALAASVGVAVLGAPPAGAVPIGDPAVVTTVPSTPWEIVPLPAGGSFVVERDGGIAYLDAQDQLAPTLALARTAIPSVRKLLGLALAPDFATTGLVYLYVSQDVDPDASGPATGTNGIWRLRASGSTLTVVDQVFGAAVNAGIDSDGNHDGGRMVFGPDGYLFVTTGDIHQPTRPQDVQSLNGKILRFAVPQSGPLTPPADNPFVADGGTAVWVWSYGHRHPQGLAFAPDGRLWETEHGPTGEMHGTAYPGGNGQTGRDELNLISKGGNYGWPLVSGPDNGPGMIAPAAVSGDSPAWAPGDLAVGADGSLYAPFLAGERLHRFDVSNGVVVGEGDYLTGATAQGRLRVAVARGQDLLVAQDSASGAKIFRIPLSAAPVAPVAPVVDVVVDGTQVRQRTVAVAARLKRVLSRAGGTRLLAGGAVKIRSLMPYAGVVSVRVHLGRNARGRVVDRSQATITGADLALVKIRLPRKAQATLRDADTPFVTIEVVYRLDGGTESKVTRRVCLGSARS